MASQRAPDSEAARVASRRDRAQQHLCEIEDNQVLEQEKEAKRMEELERETRRREVAQAADLSSSTEPKEKAGRLRTAGGRLRIRRHAQMLTRSRCSQPTPLG